MFRRSAVLLLAAAAAGSGTLTWACMGWFPTTSLIESRRDEMLAAPPASFSGRVQKLLPLEDAALVPQEGTTETEQWEAASLPADQVRIIEQMRGLKDPVEAETLGRSLPIALRNYVTGAVAFHAARQAITTAGSAMANYGQAITHFEAVVALPASQRDEQALRAQYMLGRCFALRGEQGDADRAIDAFRKTRAIIAAGAPDPLGLGVASYGEEGRLALDRDDPASAVRLYAQQAAHGSMSGRNSLLRLAKRLVAADRREAALADPVMQRVVVAYVLERLDDNAVVFDYVDLPSLLPAVESGKPPEKVEAGRSDSTEALLAAVVSIIEHSGPEHWSDTSLLASAAYHAGRFEVAERLARLRETPESDWILAKLSVRSGRLDEAAGLYAKALDPATAKLSGDTGYLIPDPRYAQPDRDRATAEWGVLELSRGEFIEAFRLLLKAGGDYTPSADYIAERVLTADELKTVVDQDFPLRDQPAHAGDSRWNTSPWTSQRLLLARRLMRDGRYDEAYDYFGDRSVTDEDGKQGPRMAKLARQYADDLEVAGRWWHQPTTRAAALFDAAMLSRHHGMELFGYEGAPDFNTWGGAFEMESKLPAADGQGFVTPDELTRFDATAPQPAKRYHYRYQAADEAVSATKFVPKRSQAFAAMLCQATSWVIDRDPSLASELYRRYLREGAYVPWGDTFGRACPEPDFDRAERLRRHELWQRMKGFVRTFGL